MLLIRVADPDGVDLGLSPTFKKNPNPGPAVEKKLDTNTISITNDYKANIILFISRCARGAE